MAKINNNKGSKKAASKRTQRSSKAKSASKSKARAAFKHLRGTKRKKSSSTRKKAAERERRVSTGLRRRSASNAPPEPSKAKAKTKAKKSLSKTKSQTSKSTNRLAERISEGAERGGMAGVIGGTIAGMREMAADTAAVVQAETERRENAVIDRAQDRTLDGRDFDAASDAVALYEAAEGNSGTDERRVLNTAWNRTPEQLEAINTVYRRQYGSDLFEDLTDDLEDQREINQIRALRRGDRGTALGEALVDATDGIGSDPGAFRNALRRRGLSDEDRERAYALYEREEGVSVQEYANDRYDNDRRRRHEMHALLRGDRREARRIEGMRQLEDEGETSSIAYFRRLSAEERTALLERSGRTPEQLARRFSGPERDEIMGLLNNNMAVANAAAARDASDSVFGTANPRRMWDAMTSDIEDPAERRQAQREMEEAYNRQYGPPNLESVVDTRISGARRERTHVMREEGQVSAGQAADFAMRGADAYDGEAGDVIANTPTEELNESYSEATGGRNLQSDIETRLSGRERIDARIAARGEPSSPEEAVAWMRERAELEGSGGFVGAFSDSDDRMMTTVERAESAIEELEAARQSGDTEAIARLERRVSELTGVGNAQVDAVREDKDAVVETTAMVATGVVAGVAVVTTGGLAAPAAALMLGAATNYGTRRALMGETYDHRNTQRDLTEGAIEGLAVMGGIRAGRYVLGRVAASPASSSVGRVAQSRVGRFTMEGTVDGAVAGGLAEGGRAFADSSTYLEQGRFQDALARTGIGVGFGALGGGAIGRVMDVGADALSRRAARATGESPPSSGADSGPRRSIAERIDALPDQRMVGRMEASEGFQDLPEADRLEVLDIVAQNQERVRVLGVTVGKRYEMEGIMQDLLRHSDMQDAGRRREVFSEIRRFMDAETDPSFPRHRIMREAIETIARPGRLVQGNFGSCQATSAQYHFAKSDPAGFLSLIRQLASPDGQATTRAGAVMRRGSTADAQVEDIRQVDALFQSSAMEHAGGRAYNIDPSRGDVGFVDGKDGLADGRVAELLTELSGERHVDVPVVKLFEDPPPAVVAERRAAFERELQEAAANGDSLQVTLSWADGPHGHAVVIEGMTDEGFIMRNSWGAADIGHATPDTSHGPVRTALDDEGRSIVSREAFYEQLESYRRPETPGERFDRVGPHVELRDRLNYKDGGSTDWQGALRELYPDMRIPPGGDAKYGAFVDRQIQSLSEGVRDGRLQPEQFETNLRETLDRFQRDFDEVYVPQDAQDAFLSRSARYERNLIMRDPQFDELGGRLLPSFKNSSGDWQTSLRGLYGDLNIPAGRELEYGAKVNLHYENEFHRLAQGEINAAGFRESMENLVTRLNQNFDSVPISARDLETFRSMRESVGH